MAKRRCEASPAPTATCPREIVLPIRPPPDFSVVFGAYAGRADNRHMLQTAGMPQDLVLFQGCVRFVRRTSDEPVPDTRHQQAQR